MPNFLQEWGERVDRIQPAIEKAGHRADSYACDVIDLLGDIKAGVEALSPAASAYEFPRLPVPAAGTRRVEGRQGYLKVVERIAVVAAAATDLDIFVGEATNTGFRLRYTFTAAGKDQDQPNIVIPEGMELIFVNGAGEVQVNLQIRRVAL